MRNSFSKLRMCISPSATWFDALFIDVRLVFGLPISPEIRENEWVREYVIHHDSFEIPSSITLWIHRDIAFDLSLDMHETSLEYSFWIYFFECCSYPNSSICRTRDYVCVLQMISEKSKILNDIFFLFSILYTEPDNFLYLVSIVNQ